MTPAQKLAQSRKPRSERKPGGTRTKHWICGLRAKREALRLSQREVCKAVPFSIAGYSEIENGSDPQLTTAYRFAKFFGCSIEELWKPLEDQG